MSDKDFLAWHEYHAAIFALDPVDSDSVLAWRNALDSHPIDEVFAASEKLLVTAPKSFRHDHVPGFFRILNGAPRKLKQFASACRCPSCEAAKRGENATKPKSSNDFSFVRESAMRAGRSVF